MNPLGTIFENDEDDEDRRARFRGRSPLSPSGLSSETRRARSSSRGSMRPPRSLAAVLALALVARVAAEAANGTAQRLVVTFRRGNTRLASEACESLNRAPRLVSSAGETTSFAACLRSTRGACLRAFAAKGGLVDGFAGTLDRDALACLRADFVEEDAEVRAPERFFFSETGDDSEDVSRRVLLERDARDGRAHEARRADARVACGRRRDERTSESLERKPRRRSRLESVRVRLGARDGTRDAALAARSTGPDVSSPGRRARAARRRRRPRLRPRHRRSRDARRVSRPAFLALARTRTYTNVREGVDVVGDGCAFGDCAGHGTHVAALVAGRTVGVAPEAALHSVRVLGRDGRGRVSDVLAGLEWTRAFLEAKGSPQTRVPSVLVLALGLRPGTASETLESAVTTLVKEHGVFVVAAGGNDPNRSACDASPARRGDVFAVGASDAATSRTRTGRTSGRAWTRSRPAFACGARTPSFATTIPRMTTTTTPSTPR